MNFFGFSLATVLIVLASSAMTLHNKSSKYVREANCLSLLSTAWLEMTQCIDGAFKNKKGILKEEFKLLVYNCYEKTANKYER
jgi:hypothetical protein